MMSSWAQSHTPLSLSLFPLTKAHAPKVRMDIKKDVTVTVFHLMY